MISAISAAQTAGCTDPEATNFDAQAFYNDGSCSYDPAAVAPATSVLLDAALSETSGIILWNGKLWSHNDDTDINLYASDTVTGTLLQTVPLTGTTNTDWEEIAQDDGHLYIGDFGNNANGNRTDLHILKIDKSSVLAGSPTFETISFSYSDQTSFTATGVNNTDFDCEAMVVTSDSIYLFTKQWVSYHTSLYALPKTAGAHVAQLRGTLNVNGLITGASIITDAGLITLIGYTSGGVPFFTLLYDYTSDHFFEGCVRQLTLNLPGYQTEGIASSAGLTFYVTNEALVIPPFINIPQKLHKVDLSEYTSTTVNPPVAEWTGTTDSDWFTLTNWSPQAVPQSYQHVVVMPASHPLIITHPGGEAALCRDMTVETGAQAVVNTGNALLVRRNLTVKE